MASEHVGIDTTVMAFGDEIFFRALAIPLAELAAKLPTLEGKLFDRIERVKPQVGKATASAVAGLDGLALLVLTFTGAVIASRLIEKVWDEAIWPRIAGAWGNLYGSNSGAKRYGLGLNARLGGKDVTLLVVAVGSDAKQVEAQQKHIPKAFSQAVKEAASVASGLTMVYVIEDGKISGPQIFADDRSALAAFKNSVSICNPKFIRPAPKK